MTGARTADATAAAMAAALLHPRQTRWRTVACALALLGVALVTRVHAASYTSSGGGDWLNPATWNSGSYPSSSIDYVYVTGGTVTCTPARGIQYLSVSNGATLTMSGNLVVYGSMVIDGTLNLNNGITACQGTTSIAAGVCSMQGLVAGFGSNVQTWTIGVSTNPTNVQHNSGPGHRYSTAGMGANGVNLYVYGQHYSGPLVFEGGGPYLNVRGTLRVFNPGTVDFQGNANSQQVVYVMMGNQYFANSGYQRASAYGGSVTSTSGVTECIGRASGCMMRYTGFDSNQYASAFMTFAAALNAWHGNQGGSQGVMNFNNYNTATGISTWCSSDTLRYYNTLGSPVTLSTCIRMQFQPYNTGVSGLLGSGWLVPTTHSRAAWAHGTMYYYTGSASSLSSATSVLDIFGAGNAFQVWYACVQQSTGYAILDYYDYQSSGASYVLEGFVPGIYGVDANNAGSGAVRINNGATLYGYSPSYLKMNIIGPQSGGYGYLNIPSGQVFNFNTLTVPSGGGRLVVYSSAGSGARIYSNAQTTIASGSVLETQATHLYLFGNNGNTLSGTIVCTYTGGFNVDIGLYNLQVATGQLQVYNAATGSGGVSMYFNSVTLNSAQTLKVGADGCCVGSLSLYANGVTVNNAGSLLIQTGATIVPGNVGITMNGGGLLAYDGCAWYPHALTWNGGVLFGPASGRTTVFNLGATYSLPAQLSQWSGEIQVSGSTTYVFTFPSGTATTGGTPMLSSNGPTLEGFIDLSGNPLVVGAFTIRNGGTMQLTGAGGTMQSGSVTIAAGGVLRMMTGAQLDNTLLQGTGTFIATGCTLTPGWDIAASVVMQGPQTAVTTTIQINYDRPLAQLQNYVAGTLSVSSNTGSTLTLGTVTVQGSARLETTGSAAVAGSVVVNNGLTLNAGLMARHDGGGIPLRITSSGSATLTGSINAAGPTTLFPSVDIGPGMTVAGGGVQLGQGGTGVVSLDGCTVPGDVNLQCGMVWGPSNSYGPTRLGGGLTIDELFTRWQGAVYLTGAGILTFGNAVVNSVSASFVGNGANSYLAGTIQVNANLIFTTTQTQVSGNLFFTGTGMVTANAMLKQTNAPVSTVRVQGTVTAGGAWSVGSGSALYLEGSSKTANNAFNVDGGGTVFIDGVTIISPVGLWASGVTVNGPTAVGRTTTFQLTVAHTVPVPITAWIGTISVTGAQCTFPVGTSVTGSGSLANSASGTSAGSIQIASALSWTTTAVVITAALSLSSPADTTVIGSMTTSGGTLSVLSTINVAGVIGGTSNVYLSGCVVRDTATLSMGTNNLFGPLTNVMTTFAMAATARSITQSLSWSAGTLAVTCSGSQVLGFTGGLVMGQAGVATLQHSGSCVFGGSIDVKVATLQFQSSNTAALSSGLSISSSTPTGTLQGRLRPTSGTTTVGLGMTIAATAIVGDSGSGTLQLDGCLVKTGAQITSGATIQVSPTSTRTTTFETPQSLTNVGSWQGTVATSLSALLTLSGATVTGTAAKFTGSAGATLAGSIGISAGTLTFVTTGIAVGSAGLSVSGSGQLSSNALLSVPTGALLTLSGGALSFAGSLPVAGRLTLSAGSQTQSGAAYFTGTGRIDMDGVTFNEPAATFMTGFSGSIYGPTAAATTSFNLPVTGDVTFPSPILQWAGSVYVAAATASGSLLVPTGTQLSGTAAKLSTATNGGVSGTLDLNACPLQSLGTTIKSSRTFVLKNTAGGSGAVTGTWTATGLLQAETNVALNSGGTFGGAGTLVLTGCTLNDGAVVTTAAVWGPQTPVTTTVALASNPRTMPTLTNWAAGSLAVTCNAAQTLTVTSMATTGSVNLQTQGLCAFGGATNINAGGYTITAAPNVNSNAWVVGGTGGTLTGVVTATGDVSLKSGVTVDASGRIGQGGAGRVTLDGCTINGAAKVTSQVAIYGPASSSTTTLGGGLTLYALTSWAGTVMYGGSGVLNLTAAVVDTATASFNGGSGAQLTGSMTVNNAMTLTFAPATVTTATNTLVLSGAGGGAVSVPTGALVVGAAATLTVQNALTISGSWSVAGLLQLFPGSLTQTNNMLLVGGGTVALDGVTVVSPPATLLQGFTGTLTGPTAVRTTTFRLNAGDFALVKPITTWAGTLTVDGASTASLSLPALTVVTAPTANLTCTNAGAVAGAVDINGQTLSLWTAAVANGKTLNLLGSATSSLLGTGNALSGGILSVQTGVTINAATLSGAGTVQLTGCTVNPAAVISSATVQGPQTAVTTTFALQSTPRVVPTLTGWAAGTITVSCGGTQALTFGELATTGSATLNTQGTCRVSTTDGTPSAAVKIGQGNTLTCNPACAVQTWRVVNQIAATAGTLAGTIATTANYPMHVSGPITVSASVTANDIVIMGVGAIVAASAVVGNSGVGPVQLTGCTVNNGAALVATNLWGPNTTHTTTFALGSSPMSLSSPLSNWAGVIVVDGSNTLTVTNTALGQALMPGTVVSAGLTGTGASPSFASSNLNLGARNTLIINSIAVAASTTLALSSTAGQPSTAQVQSAVTVSGTLRVNSDTILASAATVTASGAGLVDMRPGSVAGPTVSIGGTGTTALDGCTVYSPATLTTATITGPAIADRITTLVAVGTALTLPTLTGWTGAVMVNGTSTMTFTAPVFTATSQLLLQQNAVVVSSTSSLQGSIRSVATAGLTPTLTFTAATTAATGSVVFGSTEMNNGLLVNGVVTTAGTVAVAVNLGVRWGGQLVVTGSAAANFNTGSTVTGSGVVTATGTVRLLTGSVVQPLAVVGNGGAGTVILDGTTVNAAAALAATTIQGPTATSTTTFNTVSGSPQTVPSLTAWAGTVLVQGTGAVTFQTMSSTGAAATLTTSTGTTTTVNGGTFRPASVLLASGSTTNINGVTWAGPTLVSALSGGAALNLNGVSVAATASTFNGLTSSPSTLTVTSSVLPTAITVTPAWNIVAAANMTLGTGANINPLTLTVLPDAYVSFDSTTSFGTPGNLWPNITITAPAGLRLIPSLAQSGGVLPIWSPTTVLTTSARGPVWLDQVSITANISLFVNGLGVSGQTGVILQSRKAALLTNNGVYIRYPGGLSGGSNVTFQSLSNGTAGERLAFFGKKTFDFAGQTFGVVNINTCLYAPDVPDPLPQNVYVEEAITKTCPFVDAYHACESNPCDVTGTVECVNYQQKFVCNCKPGYSGVLCQTDINECASNPCNHGGTCYDHPNYFTCQCIPQFQGLTCLEDVNECLTNDGFCPMGTYCTNLYGTYNCSVQFYPNTNISSPDPILRTYPYVLGRMDGQRLRTWISMINVDFSTLSFWFGPRDQLQKYPCAGLNMLPPINDTQQQMECTIPPGVGADNVLSIWQYGATRHLTTHLQNVSFPAPHLEPGSLRRNQTGYPSINGSELILDNANLVTLQIYGYEFSEFDTNAISVKYGEADKPDEYTCAVKRYPFTTRNILTCDSQVQSQGIAMKFIIKVGGQLAPDVGLMVTFPVIPLITGVQGCTNNTNYTTILCPTEGNITITITGTNFVQQSLVVTVGGALCTNALVRSVNLLTCTLPMGAGGEPRNVVVNRAGYSSPPTPYLTYAGPTITNLTGCHASPPGALNVAFPALYTMDCNRFGGDIITMQGLNFGQSGAVILVGTTPCENPTQDPVTPHRKVTCRVPSGTGVFRPILLLQGGGTVTSGPTAMSYETCKPGFYVTGLTCTSCNEGEFSNQESAQKCSQCLAGKYSGLYPRADCLPCPKGQISINNASACFNCSLGRAQPSQGQDNCPLCKPGSFSAVNGSADCEQCAPATAQSNQGQSTCSICGIGQFNENRGQAQCKSCTPGSYNPDTGKSTCRNCPPGYVQPRPGMTTCVQCGVGTYAATEGLTGCDRCSPGFFQPANASSSCSECQPGSNQPRDGSTACELCPVGRYSGYHADKCTGCPTGSINPYANSSRCWSCPLSTSTSNPTNTRCECIIGFYATARDETVECIDCPRGSICNISDRAGDQLIAEDGWWRTDNNTLLDVGFLPCLQQSNCVNGACAPFRVGPLCAVCQVGYTSSSQSAECTKCPERNTAVGATVGFSFLLAGGLIIILVFVWRSDSLTPRVVAKRTNKIKAYTPEHRASPNYAYSFKLLVTYLQITTSLFGLVNMPWPSAFSAFLKYFSFVNLEFIPWGSVGCVASLDFFDKLALVSWVPVSAIALLAGLPWLFLYALKKCDYADSNARRKKLEEWRHKLIKIVMFAIFLMYPSVSSQVLSFFVCTTVNGTSYLVADFSLHCYESRWNQYLPLAIVDVFLYPIGVPFMIWVILFRNRRRLRVPAVRIQMGIVYEAYAPEYWWWELADLCEKLILCSCLWFFDISAQCPVGMVVCCVHLMALLRFEPYIRKTDDRLAVIVQCHIFLLLCIAYVLQQNSFVAGSAEDVAASTILFIVLGILTVLILYNSFVFIRRFIRGHQRAKAAREALTLEHNPLADKDKPDGNSSKGLSATPNDDEDPYAEADPNDELSEPQGGASGERSGTSAGTRSGVPGRASVRSRDDTTLEVDQDVLDNGGYKHHIGTSNKTRGLSRGVSTRDMLTGSTRAQLRLSTQAGAAARPAAAESPQSSQFDQAAALASALRDAEAGASASANTTAPVGSPSAGGDEQLGGVSMLNMADLVSGINGASVAGGAAPGRASVAEREPPSPEFHGSGSPVNASAPTVELLELPAVSPLASPAAGGGARASVDAGPASAVAAAAAAASVNEGSGPAPPMPPDDDGGGAPTPAPASPAAGADAVDVMDLPPPPDAPADGAAAGGPEPPSPK